MAEGGEQSWRVDENKAQAKRYGILEGQGWRQNSREYDNDSLGFKSRVKGRWVKGRWVKVCVNVHK